MLGRSLLIIDDDKLWGKITAAYFSGLNYTTYVAHNCADGIRSAESLKPDYIFLDYHLGDGDGRMVCTYIRSSESLKKTILLLVSADATIQEAAYKCCQADHFILKGVPYNTMHEIMLGLRRRVFLDCGILEKDGIRLETFGFQVFKDSKPFVKLSPERFRLFSLLLGKAPDFVTEDEIAGLFYPPDVAEEKRNWVKVLLHRLRHDLGEQLAARIHNQRGRGWAYAPVSPKKADIP